MLTKKENNGYTLLEVLIAISIIIAGIFAVMTLVVRGLTVTNASLDYLVAGNLAREGIEMVRNRRDSNWYQNKNFDDGLTDITYYTAVIDYNDSAFTFVPDALDSTVCQLKRQGGVYTRDTGLATNYYRLIYLNDICQNLSADPLVPGDETVKTAGADCGFGETKIGIALISKVKWQNQPGETKTLELNDRLYNWR